MNLSSDIYEISIKKKDNLLSSFEKPEYDLIYNTHGYKKEDSHSAFIVEIKTRKSKTRIAFIGAIDSHTEHCAVLNGSELAILMNCEIVLFDLMAQKPLKSVRIGDECYFSIHPVSGGYIIHGQRSILRLNRQLDQVWSFCGADIFVTSEGGIHDAFIITDKRILVEDCSGKKYALDMNGKRIWDTTERTAVLGSSHPVESGRDLKALKTILIILSVLLSTGFLLYAIALAFFQIEESAFVYMLYIFLLHIGFQIAFNVKMKSFLKYNHPTVYKALYQGSELTIRLRFLGFTLFKNVYNENQNIKIQQVKKYCRRLLLLLAMSFISVIIPVFLSFLTK